METHTKGDQPPNTTDKLRNTRTQANKDGETGSALFFAKSGGGGPAPTLNGCGDGEEAVWREVLELGHSRQAESTQLSAESYQATLQLIAHIFRVLHDNPYCLPLHLLLANSFLLVGYPDLAAGAAYKAVLLSDAVKDAADEYHAQACEALSSVVSRQPDDLTLQIVQSANGPVEDGLSDDEDSELDAASAAWLQKYYLPLTYCILCRSLTLCGCLRTAHTYAVRARHLYPHHDEVQSCYDEILQAAANHLGTSQDDLRQATPLQTADWPDSGFVRREAYAWNEYEPDRLTQLPILNDMMAKVAPKLEVRAVELPALVPKTIDSDTSTVTQLGVFAKEDISPGELILDESTMLTANNKLLDALCDACSADLPNLDDDEASHTATCPDCEAVFCSEDCYTLAMETYHPALCERDVEAIAKDVPPAEAANSLYALLLLRALAMAETQQCHPLALKEVKYIWGDFHYVPPGARWKLAAAHNYAAGKNSSETSTTIVPPTLPFSFAHNIRLPFHMLEKMDIDIFAHPHYDVWVFNTLYAKFRGTASARLSGLGGRALRGPEVSAVHAMWCLANHSCDPNVSWLWGGKIQFRAREERMSWTGRGGARTVKNVAGIKKGEEVLNHYCDVHLPVKERREWAVGALGGDCQCERCVWEARKEEDEGEAATAAAATAAATAATAAAAGAP